MMPTHLAVSGLSKTFVLHVLGGKRVAALRDVSFEVSGGAFVAIVGPSGGGKSTLLKCLYRTYLASAGALTYRAADGRAIDLATADDDTIIGLRGVELGYVSQFLRPTPRVTAVDLVARALIGRGDARDEARARAAAILRRLTLPDDLLDAYPALFSGGEQQRVNLARALIAPPRLLLLDEPTSALDAANQETVIALMREVHAAGTTIIGTFHDLTLVRRLADRYLLIRGGAIAGAGAATDVSFEALAATAAG